MEYKLFEDISAVEGKVVLKFDLGENTEHVINIILRHKQPTTPYRQAAAPISDGYRNQRVSEFML